MVRSRAEIFFEADAELFFDMVFDKGHASEFADFLKANLSPEAQVDCEIAGLSDQDLFFWQNQSDEALLVRFSELFPVEFIRNSINDEIAQRGLSA